MALSDTEIEKRKAVIATTQDENQKVTRIIDLAFDILYQNKVPQANALLEEAALLATQIKFKDGLGRVRLGKAAIAYFTANYDDSALYSDQAIEIFQQTNNKELLAETYTNLGMSHWSQGSYSKALDYVFKGIHLYQESGKSGRLAYALYMLGSFYLDLNDPDNAEKNFLASQKALEIGDPYSVSNARSWIGLANVAFQRDQYTQALECLDKALKLQEESNDQFGMSRTFNDFGKIYRKLNDIDQAYLFYGKSLNIRLQATDKQALITTYLDLGEFNFEQQEYALAVNYLQNGLKWAEKLRAKVKMYRAHLLLSQIYDVLEEYDKAYHHLKQHNEIKDSVMGKDANLKIRNLESQFAKERSEKEAEIYRLKNVELKQLYDEIEHKNQAITDSIEYARRIQNAMLPLHSDFLTYQEYAFIFYKPRDIVSGDFYWFTSIPHPDNASLELIFIAAVDCTGHGVPGAFMSMIGHNLLNNVVKQRKIYAPENILTSLHLGVKKALKQDQNDNQDGMDLALVVIDELEECIHFAGANNPLVYVQNGELHRIKGNKQGIGGGKHRPTKKFDRHTVSFKDTPGMFYIFSDGYQDQFGGADNKKFMKPRFRQLLFDIHHLPLIEQRQQLVDTLEDWMGNEPQIDDILVMGLKLGY
ncbi:tetratricopeptide repeat protein [Microscilla marina]|uniref:Serine/threonine protein kinases n=1 Tax=Microscilla marina ATCC 23134 TaxID=313606 RepID=A1ZEW4_MICM2|nr:tetratricopeptide repeat protein [Microscilla marina]EAY31066.1 serine/threonine protein kinases [Microscilla marina ATCC 23134]